MHILYNIKNLELIIIIDLENANPSTYKYPIPMYPNCKLFPWIPPHTFPYVHSLPTREPTLISRDSHLSTMWAQNTKTFSL